MSAATRIALVVLCAAVYLQFAPGRIVFPDDEIVYQTTRSLVSDGDLSIEGIPKRTGELKGRPDGTFGWAPGVDGKRYGFFGHALSFVAVPAYALGRWGRDHAPEQWRHAIRSDTYFFHQRSPGADWPRLTVSMTNCVVTAVAAWVLAEWIIALGYSMGIGIGVALAYAFGTSAWPYANTFLSEPLSALMLLVAALSVTRYLDGYRRGWLLVAAAMSAASVHAHVLNIVAVPAFVGWVVLALRRDGALVEQRRTLTAALVIGAVGLALLGVSQYQRFGSPWETGRYDHYSHFVIPSDGLVAMLVGPGRSIFVYSPALLVALLGVRRFAGRHRDVAGFVLALCVLRWLFVASRSDWWGGWAIGPRYLVPLIPFMLLPLAEVLARAIAGTARDRLLLGVALLACGALCMHLADHSILEHMFAVSKEYEGREYIQVSHWRWSATPIVGFFDLPPDSLRSGALKLAEHGFAGLSRVFDALLAVAVACAAVLATALTGRSWPSRPTPDAPGDVVNRADGDVQ